MKKEESFKTYKDEHGTYQFDPALIPGGRVERFDSNHGEYIRVDRIEYLDAIFSIYSLESLPEEDKIKMRSDFEDFCPKQ